MPAKEKKKEKKSRFIKKLARSKSESIASQSQRAPGLVGLLEIMRAQMEACFLDFAIQGVYIRKFLI